MTVKEFYEYCRRHGYQDVPLFIYEPCECRDVEVKQCDIDAHSTCVVLHADCDDHWEDGDNRDDAMNETAPTHSLPGLATITLVTKRSME